MSAAATVTDVLAGTARWCVVEGDNALALPALPTGCVDALVTDPPSGIAFMGAEWDRNKGGRAQWVAWLSGILSDARRATRDGGRAIVWSLPRTSHWTGCAVEDAGWSIESTVTHLFGTGWPKGKSQLKPAAETWWLARTGRSEALNVEACRVGSAQTVTRRSGNSGGVTYGRDERVGEWTNPPGRYPPNVVLSHSPGCVLEGTRKVRGDARQGGGTRPGGFGNVGSPSGCGTPNARGHADPDGTESVEAWRCVEGCPVAELDRQSGVLTVGGGQWTAGRAGNANAYGAANVRPAAGYGDTGTASRFFPQFPTDDPDAPWSEALFRYVAKPSRAERNAGCEALPQAERASVAPVASGKVMRCAECRRTHPMTYRGPCHRCGSTSVSIDDAADDGGGRDGCRVHANTHPTCKSVALMRWLLRLVTKPGDVILDPFGGSGTTGVAALLEGRRVVLIEREPAFAAIARARCAAADGSDWTAPIVAPADAPREPTPRQLPLFAAGAR